MTNLYLQNDLDSPLAAAVAERDQSTMQMVQSAIANKRVLLAFQPIVQSVRPDRPAFWEGLIRVLDETGRVIPARDFIEAVEATEMGRELDCQALNLGLETLAENQDLRLSINLSARSIGFPKWMETLNRWLAIDSSLGERLILEITESSAITMPDLVGHFMREQQAHGISFALDDFGAGYTSFRHLRDFYFDMIKIDAAFIKGIANNPDNQILTKALVSIAEHFDMFTVAEFVETQEDAAYLVKAGIDCLQGHYFGAATISPPWKHENLEQKAS